MTKNSEARGQWSSKFGFILASAGSAIGLGNIWRFPYLVGENGGAAFVVIYILCILFICLPYLFAEIALGRHTNKNPLGAVRALQGNAFWKLVGGFGVLIGFTILSYYAVIAGWALGYVFKSLFQISAEFGRLIGDPWVVLFFLATFNIITAAVVYLGVNKGIERCAIWLMPILLFLMIIVIIRGLTLDGAGAGVAFYLKPDFSKVTGFTVLQAMGQAFFSLSLGMGILITYGSYLSKKEDIISSGIYIAGFDTLIALLAGLMIFPALFAMGQQPNQGPSLVFVVLPEIFQQLPFGGFVAVVFFLLLSIAALTSTISLLEVPVSYLVDEHKIKRHRAVWVATGFCFLLGIPSALSTGASPFLSNMKLFGQEGFLSIMDFVWGNIGLALGALSFCIYIAWIWGVNKAIAELSHGSPLFVKTAKVWSFFIRYVCPALIFIVLLKVTGIIPEG